MSSLDIITPLQPVALEKRAIWPAMKKGLAGKCPNCGTGKLFYKYLKVNDHCSHCHEELFHQRADDAPPYFTIFIVGHIVVAAMLIVEKTYRPELWIHMALWVPLTIALSVWMLQPLKGATIGLQWANRMHGFGAETDSDAVAQQ
tara:strand:- start:1395 stop:1829 length:435 start_codon:yes stop_codon:yes gene_type:complete